MTPTHICHQMNKVYEALESATPRQLLELYAEARTRALGGCSEATRFCAQLWYELERRKRRTST